MLALQSNVCQKSAPRHNLADDTQFEIVFQPVVCAAQWWLSYAFPLVYDYTNKISDKHL